MPASVPEVIRTERLLLRPYRPDDAHRLQPILVANVDHLQSWIPKHVWEPVDVAELERRLTGYADAFAADIEWRYAATSLDGQKMVGSVCLFPRDSAGRVAAASADRAEIGYWIRRDLCGRGYATEVSQAMVGVARSLPGIGSIEIRCNASNGASAAVPRRLGFQLAVSDPGGSQVWALSVSDPPEES